MELRFLVPSLLAIEPPRVLSVQPPLAYCILSLVNSLPSPDQANAPTSTAKSLYILSLPALVGGLRTSYLSYFTQFSHLLLRNKYPAPHV